MSPLWLGTSWKMTKTLAEGRHFAGRLVEHLATRGTPEVQLFVVPPFTAIAAVSEVLGPGSPVLVGAQDAHWEDRGAWTGEVSVPQVKDAGARLVEIGHSERREHFGETVSTTRRKVAATLAHGLTPLLCIGEDAAVQERGESAAFILDQAAGALDGLDEDQLGRVVLAYEPVWAIGEAGRPATAEELAEPFAALGRRYGGRVRGLLYGGSVDTGNAGELLDIPHVAGLFVGRAAWDVDGFLGLLEVVVGRTGPPRAAG